METTKFSLTLVLIALSLIVFLGVPALADEAGDAQPQLPHAFYGIVEVGGSPASLGIAVEAVGSGVRSNIAGNPVTTLADGSYGAINFTSQKLLVQGDIAAGAPLQFYVGGMLAEVYDVAAGGPWKADYSFQPGELTELNLRISSQPVAGQTREPTPVQTREPTPVQTSQGSSSGVSGGSVLPQLPESAGGQPTGAGTTQATEGTPQQGVIVTAETTQSGTQIGAETVSPVVPASSSGSADLTLLIVGGLLILLLVAGGIYYYTLKKKRGSDEKSESEKKEE
jgi:hypothetical protein